MSLTFESRHLSCWCFGQALLAGICGQGQGHPTAAQEKPNLLAACVLQKTEQWQLRGRDRALTVRL